MTDVKICGVTRAEDAALAASAGAAWVGVILAPGRTRTQSLEGAAAIFDATDARRVGVFVDASHTDVVRAARQLALTAVQLHGDEAPDTVRALVADGLEVWKALRVRTAADVVRAAEQYRGSAGTLLLDGWSPHAHGGTGARFDWEGVAAVRTQLPPELRVVVAGGLTPDNVAHVVALLHPDAVDVSSGVEESTGVKSAARIHEFIAAVRGAKGIP